MLINAHRSTRDGTAIGDAWWQSDGVVVGFIKWWRRGDDFRISDVEVRDGYRGRGFARAMIAAVERRERAVMYSSGSFTQLGYDALARLLPQTPGTHARIDTEPMTFVADWDAMCPVFPIRG